MRKYIVGSILILMILFNTITFATDSIPVWNSNTKETVETTTDEIKTEESIDNINGIDLKLESGAGILIEQNTGKILYEHNVNEQLRPASVTKVMTILLIMENLDNGNIKLEDKVPCSEKARKMGGSQIWLEEKEELTVHEMLKAICVVSANDCTVAMAEFIAGTEEAFVQQMNDRAKELGMTNTTFKNSHGIDEDGHVTTAKDIALMSAELMKNHPKITEYTTIWMDSLRDGKSELVNTNKLVRNYTGATGLKTGSTSLALYNLSATATKNEMSLISVIMKGPTSDVRFNEAKKLLDYGFANFSYKQLGKKDETVKTLSVSKGIKKEVDIVYEEDVGAMLKKGQDKDIVQSVNLNENLVAPLVKGEKVGEITFTMNNETVCSVNLVVDMDVKKVNLGNMIAYIYGQWFSMMR